jgi:hypothetical protein
MIEESAKQAAANNKKRQQRKQAETEVKSEQEESTEQKTPPKDRSNYKCWSCGEKGHLANSKQCPNYKKAQDKEVSANATWQEYEASMYTTVRCRMEEYVINNAVNTMQKLEPTKVLLDNQADISILHPMLLKDVQPAERQIKVKGVGGLQMVVDQQGILEGFFPVYASKDTKANVLSFVDVEDLYDIMYVQKQAFIVHMGTRDLVFYRREKLYMADWNDMATVVTTVQVNEQVYSREEVCKAKMAHEFICNSGYLSVKEAVHLLTDGNIRNIPAIVASDVERAYDIYGQYPEYVKGQMVKKTAHRMLVDSTLKHMGKELKLYTDAMHGDGTLFLVSTVNPLNLTLQCTVENQTKDTLGMGIQGQLALLRSRDYKLTIVYVDPHSSFRAMTQDFPGIEVDVGGKGDYVSKVDAKTRRIKETYRKVKCGLAWQLHKNL